MDPITLSAIFMGVQAAGGIANYFAQKSALEKAELLQSQNFKEWMAMALPNPADQQLALQELSSAGTLNPRLEQQINQAPSELHKVQANPATQAAQMNALRSLQDQGFHGGMSLQDQATLQHSQQQNQVRARGNSDAIQHNMSQRGAGDSGFAAAAQLSNAQNASNQNASAGLDAAAEAQKRALFAIHSSGQFAGTMQQNQLSQDNSVAKSQDVINQFNTNNSQNVQRRNIATINDAEAANLGNRQRIMDSNVGIRNNQQIHNKGLAQKDFENRVTQRKGAQGVSDNQSNIAIKQGENAGGMFTNLGNGAGGYGQNLAQQEYWDRYFKEKNKKEGGTNYGQPDSATNPHGKNYP